MKYFINIENNQNFQNQFHGNFGSLWVETYEKNLESSLAFLKACEESNFKFNEDFNGSVQEGYGRYQVNIKDGKRFSAADAFLKPVLNRPNLTLMTDTVVEKVIFSDKKAVGVKIKNSKGINTITCTSEIILSGGSINSPQILMLSGIGPKAQL